MEVIRVFQSIRLDENLDQKYLKDKAPGLCIVKRSEKRENTGKEYKGEGRDDRGKLDGG